MGDWGCDLREWRDAVPLKRRGLMCLTNRWHYFCPVLDVMFVKLELIYPKESEDANPMFFAIVSGRCSISGQRIVPKHRGWLF